MTKENITYNILHCFFLTMYFRFFNISSNFYTFSIGFFAREYISIFYLFHHISFIHCFATIRIQYRVLKKIKFRTANKNTE